MVRTMRKATAEDRKLSTAGRTDSARLSTLRRSTSGFTPINAKPETAQEDDFGGGSDDLLAVEEVLMRREDAGAKDRNSALLGDHFYESEVASATEDEGGEEGDGSHNEGNDGDESDDENNAHDFSEGGEQAEVAQNVENENEVEYGGDENDMSGTGNTLASGDETDTAAKSTAETGKRTVRKIRRVTHTWGEPEDTRKLLNLLEQLAMREKYVNPKTGGWRNNAFGIVAEQLSTDYKTCCNKYFRLRYIYLNVTKLLALGVGLAWSKEKKTVAGSDDAWDQVKDPKLRKLKGREFLYKEEFDSLSSVLEHTIHAQTEASRTGKAVRGETLRSPSEADGGGGDVAAIEHDEEEPSHGNGLNNVVETEGNANGVRNDDQGNVPKHRESIHRHRSQERIVNRDKEAASGLSALKRRRQSDTTSFDNSSTQELVRLLVLASKDDYYIAESRRGWRNNLFGHIAAKIGKGQRSCQRKAMKLREAYVDIEKLLSMNIGLQWEARTSTVVGSAESWARVEDIKLRRRRNTVFPFREEFASMAQKLDFEAPKRVCLRATMTRVRQSVRTSGRRPSYGEASDEESPHQSIDDSNAAHGSPIRDEPGAEYVSEHQSHRPSPCSDHHFSDSSESENDPEPPRKKRMLSNTYSKRREAFYASATSMTSSGSKLQSILDAQLAIQRSQLDLQASQLSALHSQLESERRLSQSLEVCHMKDRGRRDELEEWKVDAQDKLRYEKCLTAMGKLSIFETLKGLRSRTDGYLGIMAQEPGVRKLWLRKELEKRSSGELSAYFLEDGENDDVDEETSVYEEPEQEDEVTLVQAYDENGRDDVASVEVAGGTSDIDIDINIDREVDGDDHTSGLMIEGTSDDRDIKDELPDQQAVQEDGRATVGISPLHHESSLQSGQVGEAGRNTDLAATVNDLNGTGELADESAFWDFIDEAEFDDLNGTYQPVDGFDPDSSLGADFPKEAPK